MYQNIKSLDQLKNVVESYGVHLEFKNNQWQGCCPIHGEKTPSFMLKEENNKAKFHCFGCNASGDIIDFIIKMDNIGQSEALKKAYSILGMPLSNEASKIDKLAKYISDKMEAPKDHKLEDVFYYMLDDKTPSFLKIKYRNQIDKSKKDMRTFKVIDKGEYFQLGSKNKYGDYEHVIYNYPKVKRAIKKGNDIYFVEGEKDANNLNKLGFTATTIYSKTHDQEIWNKYKEQLLNSNIIFIGDTGEAGEEFKKLIKGNLINICNSFKVVSLPGLNALGDNKDITDWLEAGHTKDELIKVVKDTKDIKWKFYWKDFTVKENKNTGEKTITPLKTIDNFKLILDRCNTNVYINEITKVMEVETDYFENKTLDTLMVEIHSLCTRIGFKCPKVDVRDFIETIAHERSINPFKVWIDNLPIWDGKSRLKDYYNLFTVAESFDNDLKELLMRKWLLSFIGSIYDPAYKAYGLLVLKGGQGIGKSECFKRLVPIKEDWVFLPEGRFKGDRDNIQILTSNLIVELSEFARSAKAVDELKGFVTADKDKLSLKYDKYTTTSKRNNIYFATVNDGEFLIDDENRRFWVIDIEDINQVGINKFDYVQLWAELKQLYLSNPLIDNHYPCYHLTPEERELLKVSNRQFNYEGEIATELRGIFDFDNPVRIWLTGAEIARLGGLKRSSTAIARELKKMGEAAEQKRIDGIKGRYCQVGLPRCWGGHVEPKWKKRLVHLEVVENVNNPFEESTPVDKDKYNEALKMIRELQKELKELRAENERLREDNRIWEQLEASRN